MRPEENKMGTLDDLVTKDASYRATVAACSHDFTGRSLHGEGPVCVKCAVLELAWLRRRVADIQAEVHIVLDNAHAAERSRLAAKMRTKYPQNRHALEWADWIERESTG